jgi:hypothetical protein
MKSGIIVHKDKASRALRLLKAGVRSEKAMAEILGEARSLIEDRTLAGKDMHGGSFEGYSSQKYYAPIENRPAGYPSPSGGEETKAGKSRKYSGGYGQYHAAQGWGTVVSLSASNAMLGDLATAVINKGKGYIYFTTRQSAAKAHGHHFGANNLPKREFFGLSFTNIDELRENLVDEMAEMAERARSLLK